MGASRYKDLFTRQGGINSFPKVIISKRTEDRFVLYNSSKTRLDRLAFQYYGDDDYWWIILLANPEYYLEFDIPPNTIIRIPYPINDVLGEIENQIIQNKGRG